MSEMTDNILFINNKRQDEIDTFFEACQKHRDFYRGYPKAYHPLTYFTNPVYVGQSPAEMTTTYLLYPSFHAKYKQPALLPPTTGRTSGIPQLPQRTLAGRYNKQACQLYIR